MSLLVADAGRDQFETAATPDAPSRCYRHPVAQRAEAMPIGNGRLGAMVFGGGESERILLNAAPSGFISATAFRHHGKPNRTSKIPL